MIDLTREAAEKVYLALADADFDVLTRLGPRWVAGARVVRRCRHLVGSDKIRRRPPLSFLIV